MATRKIDWDNMSDEERASYNKTIDPQTHYKTHIEYPKYIYGRFGDQIMRKLVKTEEEFQDNLEREPEANWGLSMRDHGLITCPGPDEAAAMPTVVGVGNVPAKTHEQQMAETIPVVFNTSHNDSPAAKAARGRGRPPKNAAAS
jgi:hypothetical protein